MSQYAQLVAFTGFMGASALAMHLLREDGMEFGNKGRVKC
jgi:hypothetical protein